MKVPVCLPMTLSPCTLFYHCISSKAFLWTSLRKCFELVQIFKALTTRCDLVFAFDRCECVTWSCKNYFTVTLSETVQPLAPSKWTWLSLFLSTFLCVLFPLLTTCTKGGKVLVSLASLWGFINSIIFTLTQHWSMSVFFVEIAHWQ